MKANNFITPRPAARKLLTLVLLACHLLWLQGCTSQRLVPGEHVSGLAKPPKHVVSIEKTDGKLLKIDRKTGSVVFIPDSVRVKVSAADPTLTIPLSEVKQITVSQFDTRETIAVSVISLIVVTVVSMALINASFKGFSGMR